MAHDLQIPKSLDELRELLKNDIKVKIAGVDTDGVLRGKIMAKDKLFSAVKDGFGFCSVIFGWDIHDQPFYKELGVSNARNGYKDMIAKVDLSTFRRIPWENNIPFFLVSFYNPDTLKPLYACPRSLLKTVVDKYSQLGLEPMCGVEYEFYNFKETPDSLNEKGHVLLKPLTPGMFGYSLLRPTLNQEYFDNIFDECHKFNVPIESLHTETGPGVYEAALAYSPALQMADQGVLFKLAVKQLGHLRHNIMPSFMAKPHNDLPGCSGHLHFSLREIHSGENAFAKSAKDTINSPHKDAKHMSDLMQHFVAGVLKGLPSIMPLVAPNINSYKRLVEHFWAPVHVSWGFDNRTASVRIISPPSSPAKATRIEMRVPGADSNPYLAIAATLACGLYGIENKLPLDIDPMPTDVQVGRERTFEMLPKSLRTATEKMMESDSMARKVFGDDFVEFYGHTRLHEVHCYEKTVTQYEVERYLELC